MINIYAPVNNLGYGVHANNMMKALIDSNAEINLSVLGQVQSDPYFESYWRTADKNKDKFNVKNPSLFIFHDEFSNQACGAPLYVFSIFETTRLKKLSENMLTNGPADKILVTTKAHKEILESHSIGKEISVLNEGVDDMIFNTIPVDKYIDTGKFTFITVGKKEERKNTSLLIKTFMEQFKEQNVAFLIHTFNPFVHNQQNVHPFKNLQCWTDVNPIDYGFEYKGFEQNKYHLFRYKGCDLYFTVPTIQIVQMSSFYHSANVGIQVSRGEGWDLPLTEMLACGLPVIASECLGHTEYLENAPVVQKELIVPLMGTEQAKDGMWFHGDQGEWGILDADALSNNITSVLKNQEKYLIKNEDISSYITSNYSWSKAAEEFKKMCNQ